MKGKTTMPVTLKKKLETEIEGVVPNDFASSSLWCGSELVEEHSHSVWVMLSVL